MTTITKTLISVALVALPLAFGNANRAAAGGIIFNNFDNFTNGGVIDNGYRSDLSTSQNDPLPQIVADDFQLQPFKNELNSIIWYGVYDTINDDIPVDKFSVSIYESNIQGNKPTGLGQELMLIGNVNRVNTGDKLFCIPNPPGPDFCFFDIYEYSVAVKPTILNSDTRYWLSIVNDTRNELPDWYWAVGGSGGNLVLSHDLGINWRQILTPENKAEAAFLLASQIPEPSSVVGILAFSTLGLVSMWRKKSDE